MGNNSYNPYGSRVMSNYQPDPALQNRLANSQGAAANMVGGNQSMQNRLANSQGDAARHFQQGQGAQMNYGPGYDSNGNPAFHGSNRQGQGRYDRRGILRARYANPANQQQTGIKAGPQTSGEGPALPPQQSGEGAPLIHPSQQPPRPNSAGSLTAQNPATLGPQPQRPTSGLPGGPPPVPANPNPTSGLPPQLPSQQWRPDWNPGQTRDTYSAMTPEQRQVYDQYMANQLPWNAAAQNASQWESEFGEQNRRFGLEYGRNIYNDTWQQGFSRDQFTEAQRQANFNQAQQLRYANEDMINSNFERIMRERGLNESAGQFNRQQTLAELQNSQRYGLDTRSLDHNMSMDQQRQQLANRTQGWQEEYGRGQLGLQGQQTMNDFTLGTRNADLRGQELNNQFTLGQRQNQIREMEAGNQNSQYYAGLKSEDAWRQGQLTNQQRQIANQYNVDNRGLDLRGLELNNQNSQFGQRLGFDRESLQGNLGVANRGLDIESNRWLQDSQIRREQLAQERELELMRLKSQNLATMGRAVGPNVKWLRNS